MKDCFKNTKFNYVIIVLYGLFAMLITTIFNGGFGAQPDWIGQHTAFPDVFRQNFYQTGRLLPNFVFEIGGGQNIFNFAYYGLLSPLFLPAYLLPFMDLITYTSIIGTLQYIAGGILLYIFLKKHFSNRDSLFAAIIFLSMAPVVVYSHFQIMFVWYLPFLLLALIGIDKYFDKKKSLLFILSTICIILTNFYFSIGCLICLFIYSICRILKDGTLTPKLFFKKVLKISILFIIPVMVCGFFLIPTAYAIFLNHRPSISSLPAKFLVLHRPGNLFYEFFSYGITGTMLLALIANLFNKEAKPCDKFLNAVLLLFTVTPLVPYFLNGTLYLNSKSMIPFLPLYIYCFLQFIQNLKERSVKVAVPTLLTVVFLAVCFLFHRSQEYRFLMVLVEIIIFTLCFRKPFLIYLYSIIFLLCGTFNNEIQHASPDFIEHLHMDEINKLAESFDNGIYRSNVSYMDIHLCNRVFGNNFFGVSSYSSVPNSSYLDFFENHIGNNESQSASIMLTGSGNEQFYNFMGTRYIFSKTDPGFLYEKAESGKNINLYENTNAYPVAYKSKQLMNENDFDKYSFPYNTEILMNRTIVEDCTSSPVTTNIIPHKVRSRYIFSTKKTAEYKIKLPEKFRNKQLYLSFDIYNEGKFKNYEPLEIEINGVGNRLNEKDNTYYNENTNFEYIIPMENTTTLNIKVERGRYNIRNLKMYYSGISYEKYSEADNLTFNENNDTISCSTTASGGEYLVTSIPYDKGFTVTVNGKDADIEKVNKSFIGVRLEKGNNEIVFKYRSPGLKLGIIVSISGLLLLFSVLFAEKRFKTHGYHISSIY